MVNYYLDKQGVPVAEENTNDNEKANTGNLKKSSVSVAAQNPIKKPKNKGGRPKKWRRKMPLTLQEQNRRKTAQKRSSYQKLRRG